MPRKQINRTSKRIVIRANHVYTGKHKPTVREEAWMRRVGLI